MDKRQVRAFEAFVAESGAELLRIATLLTSDPHIADDVYQETLPRLGRPPAPGPRLPAPRRSGSPGERPPRMAPPNCGRPCSGRWAASPPGSGWSASCAISTIA